MSIMLVKKEQRKNRAVNISQAADDDDDHILCSCCTVPFQKVVSFTEEKNLLFATTYLSWCSIFVLWILFHVHLSNSFFSPFIFSSSFNMACLVRVYKKKREQYTVKAWTLFVSFFKLLSLAGQVHIIIMKWQQNDQKRKWSEHISSAL